MEDQTVRTKSSLQALLGSEWESLLARLPRAVLLRLSPGVISLDQGQLIATFLLNQLQRLNPIITNIYLEIDQDEPLSRCIPKWQAGSLLESIISLHNHVDPPVKLHVNEKLPADGIASHITLGENGKIGVPGIWIGCDNWICKLSSIGPEKIAPVINPIGAYTAATIAISETWKRILFPLQETFREKEILISPLDGRLIFSTFDYSPNAGGPNPILPEAIDLRRLTLVGVGASGGATIFTLASIPSLAGNILLIEPEEISLSNLNRYIVADNEDVQATAHKTDIAKDILKDHPQLIVTTFCGSFETAPVKEHDLEWVASAVDNEETRRNIQRETPKVLWDVGSNEFGDFFIWRMILEKQECMFCRLPPESDGKQSKAIQLSQRLGLQPSDWLRKMQNDEKFADSEIEAIALHLGDEPISFDVPTPGQNYKDWQHENECGRLDLPKFKEGVPIPFSPIMAGVLLAGEIVKEHLYPGQTLPGYYTNRLTSVFNKRGPYCRQPRLDCPFCHDKVFLDQYHRHWG